MLRTELIHRQGPMIAERRLSRRGVEKFPNLAQPLRGPLSSPGLLDFGQPCRDDPASISAMIESERPVVEADEQFGGLELVETRSRQPFDMMTQVVAKQSRRPSLK